VEQFKQIFLLEISCSVCLPKIIKKLIDSNQSYGNNITGDSNEIQNFTCNFLAASKRIRYKLFIIGQIKIDGWMDG